MELKHNKDLRKQRCVSANDENWNMVKDTAKKAGFSNVSRFIIELVKAYRKESGLDHE